MRQNLLVCILVFGLCFSCRDVVEKEQETSHQGIRTYIQARSAYVQDESLDFFLAYPWYAYDEGNHIIWPNFRVYSLKTDNSYYKVQVIDYYNDDAQPGHYTLRVQKEGEQAFLWDFEAQGCGNVYTNLNYKECLQNPQENIYTYLNFETQKVWKMTAAQAQESLEWDLAFNGTEVKMNAGNAGPGQNRMGELYFYGGFAKGETADFQRIAEVSFLDKGQRFFDLDLSLRDVSFALPPGVPRVVYESYWFKKRNGSDFHTAVSENWWVLKGSEEGSSMKFHVADIEEGFVGDDIQTEIVFEYFYQGPGEDTFSSEAKTWRLPVFDSNQRLIRWCLDFDKRQVANCSDNTWELRFSALNRGGQRRWLFNVNAGAIGPLSYEDMIGR